VDTIVKVAVGVALGWFVEQVADHVLRKAGVPQHTVKVVGGIAGAFV
jgi:hypothetical protein